MFLPTVTAQSAGSILTANTYNAQIKGAIDFLSGAPHVLAFSSTATSMANGSTVLLTFNQEAVDNDLIHETGTNSSRLTAKTAGWYRVTAQVEFATISASGSRTLQIRTNAAGNAVSGTRVAYVGQPAQATVTTAVQCTGKVLLNVNDYVEAFAQQSSGSPMNWATGVSSTWFSMEWIAKA